MVTCVCMYNICISIMCVCMSENMGYRYTIIRFWGTLFSDTARHLNVCIGCIHIYTYIYIYVLMYPLSRDTCMKHLGFILKLGYSIPSIYLIIIFPWTHWPWIGGYTPFSDTVMPGVHQPKTSKQHVCSTPIHFSFSAPHRCSPGRFCRSRRRNWSGGKIPL